MDEYNTAPEATSNTKDEHKISISPDKKRQGSWIPDSNKDEIAPGISEKVEDFNQEPCKPRAKKQKSVEIDEQNEFGQIHPQEEEMVTKPRGLPIPPCFKGTAAFSKALQPKDSVKISLKKSVSAMFKNLSKSPNDDSKAGAYLRQDSADEMLVLVDHMVTQPITPSPEKIELPFIDVSTITNNEVPFQKPMASNLATIQKHTMVIHSKGNEKGTTTQNNGKEASAKDNGKEASVQNNGKEASPQDDVKEASAQDNGKEASAHDDAKEASAQDDAKEASAQDDAKEASAQDDEKIAKVPEVGNALQDGDAKEDPLQDDMLDVMSLHSESSVSSCDETTTRLMTAPIFFYNPKTGERQDQSSKSLTLKEMHYLSPKKSHRKFPRKD